VKLFPTEVFTPNEFPEHTYIGRDGERLERELERAFATPKVVVSISGPSKSGKTVVVEKVLGPDNMIPVSGIEIRSGEDLWTRTLSWMEAPVTTSVQTGSTRSSQVGGEAGTKGSIFIAEASGKAAYQQTAGTSETKTETRTASDLAQVAREVAGSSFAIFLDDFHYIPNDAQPEVARQIKAAAERGVRICVATVPHRSDNVVRNNAELRGRLAQVDTTFWTVAELQKIALVGFEKLQAELSPAVTLRFAREACGSPQLMQRICLDACFSLGIEKEFNQKRSFELSDEQMRTILEQSASHSDFSTMVANMHQGPKTRGTERREHDLTDGTSGDVYRVLLRAIAHGDPVMDLPYPVLMQRIEAVCRGGIPASSSIVQACRQIDAIAKRLAPTEKIIDWDDHELTGTMSIVDPYFLFYLRASRKLDQLASRRTEIGMLPGLDFAPVRGATRV
jgi:hypothetical protein